MSNMFVTERLLMMIAACVCMLISCCCCFSLSSPSPSTRRQHQREPSRRSVRWCACHDHYASHHVLDTTLSQQHICSCNVGPNPLGNPRHQHQRPPPILPCPPSCNPTCLPLKIARRNIGM
ncbi:uncharacterized protein K489DRAFT_47170 [Dissoconium aciculare CBS 342.82]|uniref:Secreted protein n=1 Tax=Dissoconium aciculare CBS 342.82 TaxID=1314786 RepID=A0A6J3LZQ9_9PEZI|nr:uncharacterized protein K489DRAFT_47170 [Dissoconium aciculare CBS 342.82]KAF1820117.1 hypothetical protein K489DRAFT_47170 [Dissoconium aciculare CBS 342.82]